MRLRLLLGIVIVVALVRVAATHHLLAAVTDEPVHIAAGYDWLAGFGYSTDPTHPPLERILSALPLVLEGVPTPHYTFAARGNDLLYSTDHYERHLSRARLGNLLFFAIAILATAALAARFYGAAAGLVAALLFALQPSILGHAGVATTDLAVVAAVPVALLALYRWLDERSWRRTWQLGLALGLGALTKFSFVPFFGVVAIVVLALRLRRDALTKASAKQFAAMLLVAALTIWAGYRFTFEPIADADPLGRVSVDRLTTGPLHEPANWFAAHVPVPAPQFFVGLFLVKIHNSDGHDAFLFGRYSGHGWWYYFPVLFFYKTPIPFLLLFAWGCAALVRDRRGTLRRDAEPLILFAMLLLSVLPTSINIGIRHVLPLYVFASAVAAYGVVSAWRATEAFGHTALAALLLWLTVGSFAAHPDYIAYFNEFAGDDPSRIAVDSNLDWGQDLLRLGRFVHDEHIDSIHIAFDGSAILDRHGIHGDALQPNRAEKGWIVICETAAKLSGEGPSRGHWYDWLDAYAPYARIGRSIRVYSIR
jgi:hypothetical protein